MQSVTLEGECAKRESARLLPHTPEVPGMRWRTVDSLRNVHPTIVLNCTYSTPQSATAEGSRVANGVSNHDVKNEMLEYIYSSEIKSAPEYCRKYCFLLVLAISHGSCGMRRIYFFLPLYSSSALAAIH